VHCTAIRPAYLDLPQTPARFGSRKIQHRFLAG
jgi:hypothetical protein